MGGRTSYCRRAKAINPEGTSLSSQCREGTEKGFHGDHQQVTEQGKDRQC